MERSLSSFNLDRENEPVNTQNSGVVVTPKKAHYRDTLTNSLFNKDEGGCADEMSVQTTLQHASVRATARQHSFCSRI